MVLPAFWDRCKYYLLQWFFCMSKLPTRILLWVLGVDDTDTFLKAWFLSLLSSEMPSNLNGFKLISCFFLASDSNIFTGSGWILRIWLWVPDWLSPLGSCVWQFWLLGYIPRALLYPAACCCLFFNKYSEIVGIELRFSDDLFYGKLQFSRDFVFYFFSDWNWWSLRLSLISCSKVLLSFLALAELRLYVIFSEIQL